jgi:hypothetical protein
VRAGGLCAGKPCWRARGTTGFRYADRDATPDGLVALTLKTGVAGQAAITLKGKGGLVPTLSLPLAQSPAVTVQLQRRAGPCWETVLSAPADRSDGSRWKDAVP